MDFKTALTELNGLSIFGINPSLTGVTAALERLNKPHLQFPSVHIAGTNGKGSSATFVSSILKEAGYKTGLTLSPHIQSVLERIQINGKWISEENFCRIHEYLKQTIGIEQKTYFEWIILIMFVYFAEQKVDIAVLEVGLGGRFDATNVVNGALSAITTVALDHQKYLGDTVEKILIEKMQIIKSGGVAWTGIKDTRLLSILKSHCDEKKVALHVVDENLKNRISSYELGLLGDHQRQNAALALGIILSLQEKGWAISNAAIEAGFKKAYIAGRLEKISSHPTVVLDGAHNEEGVLALGHFLKNQGPGYHLLFGCLADRELEKLVSHLIPHVLSLTLVYFEGDRTRSLDSLENDAKRLSQEYGRMIEVLNIQAVNFKEWLKKRPPSKSIMVAGSLYLVSQIRENMTGT